MRSGLPVIMALFAFCCLGLAAAGETAAPIQSDATEALRRALANEEANQGPTSPYLLPVLEQLAQARWRDGDLAESVSLRHRALDIAIGAFGAGSASAAEAMTALAQADIARRRYLDAEPLLIAAGNVLTDSVASDHPALSAVFAALARIALARGDIPAAEPWGERAVAIAGKNPHQRATEPLLALAAIRAGQERFAESEKLIADALSRDREHYGPEGPAVARDLSQLGNLYLRQKRYDDARSLLEQATAIDQHALAPTHPLIADDFYDLGLVFDAMKRPDQARKSLALAVKLLECGTEEDSLRLAYAERELARVLRVAGKTAEADAASAESKRLLDKAGDEERDRERQI
jgi:tetratricopeptide (TPR) repeat protein